MRTSSAQGQLPHLGTVGLPAATPLCVRVRAVQPPVLPRKAKSFMTNHRDVVRVPSLQHTRCRRSLPPCSLQHALHPRAHAMMPVSCQALAAAQLHVGLVQASL
jgi:hypothetical protein